MANTYDLLEFQSRVDSFTVRDSLSHKVAVTAVQRSLAEGNYEEAQRIVDDARRRADKGAQTLFELPVFDEEERGRFESLATFAVHEPALKSAVSYFLSGEMMRRYREWIKSQNTDVA